MSQTTPLYDLHCQSDARMVDFGGWDMPLNYGSQIEEHHHVRRSAGMFDVSHMTVIDLAGRETSNFLRTLLANSIDRLTAPGEALYSCMLNDSGGVIDDLITYRGESDNFRLIVNAATRENDLAWINRQSAGFAVTVTEQPELAMIAIQGPQARDALAAVRPDIAEETSAIGRFRARYFDTWMVARTGYTGEDGFEVVLPAGQAPALWQGLAAHGVHPCGLGARDTLRLEAGMNLYGQDMDESVSPLECGLGWTVDWEAQGREFIGRSSLAEQLRLGAPRKQVALVLDGRGVLRHGQKLLATDEEAGVITSGTYSPTLECAIAFGLVTADAPAHLSVDMRGRQLPVRQVKAPFVRNGKALPGVLPQ